MSYAQTNEVLVRFETHALLLRQSEHCIIGIFAAGDPHAAGLRVSLNLLLKQAQQAIIERALMLASQELNVASNAGRGGSAADDGGGGDGDDEEDIIVAPTKKREEPELPVKQKTGFFGRKKEKKSSSNDIWN